MVDVSNFMDTARLEPEDVPEEGVSRTIRRVSFEPGRKPIVLYFHGSRHGLPLAPTNVQRLGKAYGTETDEWEGRRVVLRRALVKDEEHGRRQLWIHVSVDAQEDVA